ncbi:hypothetical protein H4R34_001161 [Dimargaris verticillata]|uniref:Uncharacterized protein n=1 Tax=Dimargaris verticillata TaxID=2761393 RepID=A0A9W8EE13_9FUNG|nr:hypothetical protein H4R34_001161 [Dimargaris verticillata]
MNSDKVIQAYLLSNNPANAPVMVKQVEKGLVEHLEPYIIPYRARTVKFGSPYAADNMVLLSTLSDQELKQQLPLTYYTKHAPKVVPELLRIIIAEFEQAAEDYDQFYDDNDDPSAAYPLRDQYTIPMPIILYWLVRDVLKAVIHYNQTSIAVEVKGVFEQTTMFWLWTIELGRAEMNSLLRPDNLHEEDVALLTTIFCRLKLQRACAYLMEAYDTAIDDGLIIEHMDEPALATLEEMSADGVEQLLHTLMRGRDQITWMPNRFFTWDRANIHDAWVAKPVTRASVDIDLHVNALAQLSPNDRQI